VKHLRRLYVAFGTPRIIVTSEAVGKAEVAGSEIAGTVEQLEQLEQLKYIASAAETAESTETARAAEIA